MGSAKLKGKMTLLSSHTIKKTKRNFFRFGDK